jgi:hypothetical protein
VTTLEPRRQEELEASSTMVLSRPEAAAAFWMMGAETRPGEAVDHSKRTTAWSPPEAVAVHPTGMTSIRSVEVVDLLSVSNQVDRWSTEAAWPSARACPTSLGLRRENPHVDLEAMDRAEEYASAAADHWLSRSDRARPSED